MSRKRMGRAGRMSRRGMLAILALVALALGGSSCGGGGGGGSSLNLLGVVADGLGLLPQSSVFLNNKLIAEFDNDIDPDSVTPLTFRVLVGPTFSVSVEGTVAVSGSRITFIPVLPVKPDLSDSGFQADTPYRIFLRGLPDLNTIRSTRGKPLSQTTTVDFRTRDSEPLFTDLVPGDPMVIGVMLDLDGNGVLDGDGDPATPEAEEFFTDEVDFGSPFPFVTGVPVGSASLPPPNAPQKVAIILSEPLQPATVFADLEDINGDGIPDGDGVIDPFSTADTTNPYACDDPNPGDFCPKPLRFRFSFSQEFIPDRDAFLVLATMEFQHALSGFSRHLITVNAGLTDFAGNILRNDFTGVFETGERPILEDSFAEDFEDRDFRDDVSTALWDFREAGYLQAGAGIGGDGGDGPGMDPDSNSLELDTTGNSGIFNFSSFVVPSVSEFVITIKGDKPAVVRVLDDVEIPVKVTIDASGLDGLDSGDDSVAPREGGAGGPGGGAGGASSMDGADTVRGADGASPEGTDGGGKGGLSGSGPGGGGGGGHREAGSDGVDGQGAPGSGGEGGQPYGDGSFDVLQGGSGGGGGGNNNDPSPGSPGTAGGSGGGGGGALVIECLGTFRLSTNALILVNGGAGGAGRVSGPDDAGGGGGGSGGSVLIRCLDIISLGGKIEAAGGAGGSTSSPGGRGGAGAFGFIRIEDLDSEPTCNLCKPKPPIYSHIDPAILGASVGRSQFFQTNAPDGMIVRYRFDGSDPVDGSIRPEGADIVLLDENGEPTNVLPDNATIHIFFRGAFEDPHNPNQADPDSISEWVTDITQIDGFPMVQYEIRFDIGDDIENNPPAPGVDDLVMHFSLE